MNSHLDLQNVEELIAEYEARIAGAQAERDELRLYKNLVSKDWDMERVKHCEEMMHAAISRADVAESALAAAQASNQRLQVWATRLIEVSVMTQLDLDRRMTQFVEEVRAVREDAGQVALAAMQTVNKEEQT